MSYLASPRLVFAGRFLSDVSTRNNETANYEPNAAPEDHWNPIGGASFEFIDCSVTGFKGDATNDPLMNARVSGMIDRPSGKMVDLDPQWQFSSEIWGFGVRLIDPITGELGFQGRFRVASFRDLWTRQIKEIVGRRIPNGQPSGARYISVLTDVEWGPLSERSQALNDLREQTQSDKLSLCLHQFGYFYTETHARHATGSCVGIVGPYKDREPETSIVGRRLTPFVADELFPNREQPEKLDPGKLIDAIDFEIDADTRTISFDLGHALPLESVDGPVSSISDMYQALAQVTGLRFGLLPTGEAENESLHSNDNIELIGAAIDVSGDWYPQTGGVVDIKISTNLLENAINTRIGLYGQLSNGSLLLLSRETEEGVYIRTDHFVRRMEPGDKQTVKIHSRKFGEALEGLEIYLQIQGDSGGPLSFPNKVVTDQNGEANIELIASDPGNPRGPLDGLINILAYSFKRDSSGNVTRAGTGLTNLDLIPVHIRDNFTIPANIDFDRDIKPIMAQYDQLYPIMSAHLFRLADKEMFLRYRQPLLTAFKRPIDHPNYMPVTRDLSRPKIEMIVKWLEEQPATGDPAKHDSTPSHTTMAPLDVQNFVEAFNAANRDAKTTAAGLFEVDDNEVFNAKKTGIGGAD